LRGALRRWRWNSRPLSSSILAGKGLKGLKGLKDLKGPKDLKGLRSPKDLKDLRVLRPRSLLKE
jgi:hypothetical protein